MTDRPSAYRRRLADYLPTLPDDAARRTFLEWQLRTFVAAYSAWARQVDLGLYHGDITAFDYTESLSDIGRLLAQYSERRAVA